MQKQGEAMTFRSSMLTFIIPTTLDKINSKNTRFQVLLF